MIVDPDPELEQLLMQGSAPASPHLLARVKATGMALQARDGKLFLPDGMVPLDPKKILAACGPDFDQAQINLQVFRAIGSTNDHIMAQLNPDDARTSIALAEMQSAGKGRRGRAWVSPFGRNIYVTFGRNFHLPHARLGGLSLVAGLQLVQALRSEGLEAAGLKWPNDVLLDGGKLAGILVELQPAAAGKARGADAVADVTTGVAIGIGINLALDGKDAARIDQAWSQAAGRVSMDRNRLAGRLVQKVVAALDVFAREGFAPFAEDWPRFNLYQDQPVRVLRGETVIEGIDRGIAETGDLLLETDEGVMPFNAGEVSLRPAD